MRTKKRITIVALSLVVLFLYYSTHSTPVIRDENYTYLSEMRWHNTYEAGQKVAAEEQKPMLIYFWAVWCTYCRNYQEEVFVSPEVAKVLQNDLVLVAVDLDVNKEDAQRFGAGVPPYLVFLTPQGEPTTQIPGYLSDQELMDYLRFVTMEGE